MMVMIMIMNGENDDNDENDNDDNDNDDNDNDDNANLVSDALDEALAVANLMTMMVMIMMMAMVMAMVMTMVTKKMVTMQTLSAMLSRKHWRLPKPSAERQTLSPVPVQDKHTMSS